MAETKKKQQPIQYGNENDNNNMGLDIQMIKETFFDIVRFVGACVFLFYCGMTILSISAKMYMQWYKCIQTVNNEIGRYEAITRQNHCRFFLDTATVEEKLLFSNDATKIGRNDCDEAILYLGHWKLTQVINEYFQTYSLCSKKGCWKTFQDFITMGGVAWPSFWWLTNQLGRFFGVMGFPMLGRFV
jgi:hypothetical protein